MWLKQNWKIRKKKKNFNDSFITLSLFVDSVTAWTINLNGKYLNI